MKDPSHRRAFIRGMGGVCSLPALILMTSFIGFGVLCRESGLSLTHATFITAAVWALPAQVIMVASITSGASLLATAVAVGLSSVRFMPMVAAWVPLVKSENTQRSTLLLMSHFVAITSWVFSFMRLPDIEKDLRLSYFAGFAVLLTLLNIAVTAASYHLAASMPAIMAAGLFFLMPIYFLMSLTAAAKIPAERAAMPIGLVFGPLLHWADVELSLLWAGLISGTLAYAIGRLIGHSRTAGS